MNGSIFEHVREQLKTDDLALVGRVAYALYRRFGAIVLSAMSAEHLDEAVAHAFRDGDVGPACPVPAPEVLATHALTLTPDALCVLAECLDHTTAADVERVLCRFVEEAAVRAGYLGGFYRGMSHTRRAAEGGALCKRVRKAMGYTVP